MPGWAVNVQLRRKPSKYKDLQAVTRLSAGHWIVFPVGKSSTRHNVPGNSLYTQ
jgi:hypothetical protein